MTSIPAHILHLLAPLHPPCTTFTLSPSTNLISPSSSPQTQYLYKSSPLSSPSAIQIKGEAESLRCMNLALEGIVPRLIGTGEEEGEKWMLSEWHKLSPLNAEQQRELGSLVAKMHLSSQVQLESNRFGFPVVTCCGVTEQDNGSSEGWEEFWREKRLGDMKKRFKVKGERELEEMIGEVQERVVSKLLGNLGEVKPSILHGDLWSGNVSFSSTSQTPIIFDPSSYYGHHEADLGMTRMFGGFSKEFYESYHSILPPDEPREEYEQRMDLYELHHHLNHTVMFGGSYRNGALKLMRRLIEWADGKGY